MGLNHPENLELWRTWQAGRRRARQVRHVVGQAAATARATVRPDDTAPDAGETAARWTLSTRAATPGRESAEAVPSDPATGDASPRRVLLALDAATPTIRASLLAPLPYLTAEVLVLAPAGVTAPELEGPEWSHREIPGTASLEEVEELDGLDAVVTIGQHLAVGEQVHRLARSRSVPQYVVQHGVLTPFAPPLPREATLLAWTDADARFWTAGRRDLGTTTLGSQLLWQAGHEQAPLDPAARPVFLGQIHGAELSRRVTVGAAYRFCVHEHALYRPHPAEQDLASRAVHAMFRRRGIAFAPSDVPLAELGAPVAAVFSTGILEAAARGLPAWAYGPAAPGWVHELWDRYRMRRFGGTEPTPAPARPAEEPAAAIARILEGTR